MKISGGMIVGAAMAMALTLLGGSPAAARKSAPSTPALNGTYAFRLEKICQPGFYGAMSGNSNTDPDGDARYFEFNFPGSFQNEIGVVTFNAKAHSINGSMLKVKGDLLTQNLGAAGITGISSNQFSQTTESMSGTYSTTSTSFTVNDNSSNGAVTFNAVYGAFANSTAHVVFFQNVFLNNGFSCEQSGELQFK